MIPAPARRPVPCRGQPAASAKMPARPPPRPARSSWLSSTHC